MVEQRDRAAVATFFFSGEPMVPGRTTTLSESEAHHARVRRVGIGDRIRIVDGAGTVGYGPVVRLGKAQTVVEVEYVDRVEPLPVIHLVLPIADRDRMLWLAEKATELGAFSWRPVLWRRSRGVQSRGEGVAFQSKVRLRMIAALTQCGGAWLPVLYPDALPEHALAAAPAGTRWLLDADGDPVPRHSMSGPVTIALGPEGGLDPAEREELVGAGFTPVRLAPLTLRFETAAVAGMAVARALLSGTMERARV